MIDDYGRALLMQVREQIANHGGYICLHLLDDLNDQGFVSRPAPFFPQRSSVDRAPSLVEIIFPQVFLARPKVYHMTLDTGGIYRNETLKNGTWFSIDEEGRQQRLSFIDSLLSE